MAPLLLTRDDYRNRVYGGWIGKCAGTTLGAPFKGRTELNKLSFYEPIPGQSAASDGLDFQLAWVHVLREQGIQPTSDDLCKSWQSHITYPWDEYGWAAANLRRGLRAPITGSFDNWFRHGLKGVARADIWGMIAPGSPQVAAEYAYRDAVIDHAGEGIWAAMFWAAMESAAFFHSEPQLLITIGQAMIPPDCMVSRVATIVKNAKQQSVSLLDARSRVLQAVASDNISDAALNIGFTLAGWLFAPSDFGAALCTTVNLGYETDTNAGALGTLLGIIHGHSKLPKTWIDPLGDSVVLGWGLTNLKVEKSLSELTDHTVQIGEKVVGELCINAELVDKLPEPPPPPEPEPSPAETLLAETPAKSPTVEGPLGAVAQASAADGPPSEASAVPPVQPLHTETTSDEVLEDTVSTATASGKESDSSIPEVSPAPQDQVTTFVQLEETTPAAADSELESAADPAGIVVGTTEAPTLLDSESMPVEAAALAEQVSPPPPVVDWTNNNAVKPLFGASTTTAIYHSGGFEFTVDYGAQGPVILPDIARSFTVAIRNDTRKDFMGHVHLALPPGWQVAVPGAQGQRQMLAKGGMARYGFVLKAPEMARLEPRNTVTLVLSPEKGSPITAELVFLGGSCWHFVGPFTNMDGDGFGKAFGPEDRQGPNEEFLARDGGLVRWQRRAFDGSVMDMESIFNGVPGVVYLKTTLHTPTITEARLVGHSNDGLRIWLNKQLILQRHSHEAFRPTAGYGPAQADVTLRPGDTQLMIKVVRCSDPAQFAFMIADREGRLIADVGNCRW